MTSVDFKHWDSILRRGWPLRESMRGLALARLAVFAMLISYSDLTIAKTEVVPSRGSSDVNLTVHRSAPGKSRQIAQMTPPATSRTSPARPVVVISDLSDYADDNVAILMLLKSRLFDIRAVITTSGNVCAERGAEEGRRFLDAAGARDVPVIPGFSFKRHEARQRHYVTVEKPSGLPIAFAGALGPQPECTAESKSEAADRPDPASFLIEQARATADGLTVILIGPSTVIAEAIQRDATLAKHIRNVLVMGGAINVPGNATKYAEFNVWFDPEAMAILLASNVVLTLVSLDATSNVTYSYGSHLVGATDRGFASNYLATYLKRRRSAHKVLAMWDEVAAAIAIDPELIEASEEVALAVSSDKDARYGMLLTLMEGSAPGVRRVRVVTRVNVEGVRHLVQQLIPIGN